MFEVQGWQESCWIDEYHLEKYKKFKGDIKFEDFYRTCKLTMTRWKQLLSPVWRRCESPKTISKWHEDATSHAITQHHSKFLSILFILLIFTFRKQGLKTCFFFFYKVSDLFDFCFIHHSLFLNMFLHLALFHIFIFVRPSTFPDSSWHWERRVT